MSRRFLKQLIYGSFFIIVFSLIFYFLFLAFSSSPTCFDGKKNGLEEDIDCGGSCESCEIKNLSPLIVTQAKIFHAQAGNQILIFQVKNSNPFYGANNFSYNVFGKKGESSSLLLSGESFIYAGEIKYIVNPIFSLDLDNIENISVSLENIFWSRRDSFSSPVLDIRETSTKLENNSILVSGTISNRDTFDFSKVSVEVLFFDSTNNLIGASKTEIRDLKSFTERQFTITYPSIPADPGKTKIFFDAKKSIF